VEWNSYSAYNLGSATDGLLLMVVGILAIQGSKDWISNLGGVSLLGACFGISQWPGLFPMTDRYRHRGLMVSKDG
jgi:hypothetical protein